MKDTTEHQCLQDVVQVEAKVGMVFDYRVTDIAQAEGVVDAFQDEVPDVVDGTPGGFGQVLPEFYQNLTAALLLGPGRFGVLSTDVVPAPFFSISHAVLFPDGLG